MDSEGLEIHDRWASRQRSYEGLRVVAGLLIAAWTLQVPPFTGGYVGIDVFFVLAGFFLSRSLLARPAETFREFIKDFVAFRLRRIVPLMALVVIASSVAALIVYGYPHADANTSAARAALLFFNNFHLATSHVAALNPRLAVTPFQQFWTLSVLEQAALIWGILFFFSHRVNGQRQIRVTLWSIIALSTVLSLVTSGGLNYYATFTRIDALAIGSLLAMYLDHLPVLPAQTRNLMGFGGLGTIVALACLLGPTSWYPGPYALIVAVASVAMMMACAWGDDTRFAKIFAYRRFAYLGRYSFGFYLWLFPIVIIATKETHGHPSAKLRLVLFVGAYLLAVITHHLVEVPILNWLDPHDDRVDSRLDYLITYRGTAILLVVTVIFSFGLGNMSHYKAITAFKQPPPTALELAFPTHLDPSFYPSATQLHAYIADEVLAKSKSLSGFLPGIANLAGDTNSKIFTDCTLFGPAVTSGSCVFGRPNGALTMALIGDERAASFLAALQPIAQAENFKVVLLSRVGCRNNAVTDEHPVTADDKACRTWHNNVRNRLSELKPDLVIFASDERDPVGHSWSTAKWSAGYDQFVRSIARVAGAMDYVSVLGWPRTNVDPTKCLTKATTQGICDATRQVAIMDNRVAAASLVDQTESIRELDIASYFCTTVACPAVVHGVATMAQRSIIAQSYWRTITRAVHHDLIPLFTPFTVEEQTGVQSLAP